LFGRRPATADVFLNRWPVLPLQRPQVFEQHRRRAWISRLKQLSASDRGNLVGAGDEQEVGELRRRRAGDEGVDVISAHAGALPVALRLHGPQLAGVELSHDVDSDVDAHIDPVPGQPQLTPYLPAIGPANIKGRV
jgi:hypothetical protein